MTRDTMAPIRPAIAALGRCGTCGAPFDDPGQRFCGGDQCANVFVKDPVWRERAPLGSIGYTGTYREARADIPEVSVVAVLEARGPE